MTPVTNSLSFPTCWTVSVPKGTWNISMATPHFSEHSKPKGGPGPEQAPVPYTEEPCIEPQTGANSSSRRGNLRCRSHRKKPQAERMSAALGPHVVARMCRAMQPSRLPLPAPPTTASDKAGGKSAVFLSLGRGNLSAICGVHSIPCYLSGRSSSPPSLALPTLVVPTGALPP